MGKINIFRNPFIDTQVGMLVDAYEDGLRKQTEEYWRKTIAQEIRSAIDGGTQINAEGAYLIARGNFYE